MNKLLLAALLAVPVAVHAADKPLAVKTGYRALNLPFPDHQLAFLSPGAHVDVMATFEALTGKKGEQTKEDVTATLLQNVRVLAVDARQGLIQLEVNPNEAQYAALFSSKDKVLWLTVRGDGDKDMKPMEMAVARKLFQ
jgi:hypothetical protein